MLICSFLVISLSGFCSRVTLATLNWDVFCPFLFFYKSLWRIGDYHTLNIWQNSWAKFLGSSWKKKLLLIQIFCCCCTYNRFIISFFRFSISSCVCFDINIFLGICPLHLGRRFVAMQLFIVFLYNFLFLRSQ